MGDDRARPAVHRIQAYEYVHAPFGFGGNIYGSAFFMATGFHGFHVIVGTIFLIVCLVRAYKGHFTPQQHFGFEAAAWYWHFVDVVWLFLFICIYVWGGWGAPTHVDPDGRAIEWRRLSIAPAQVGAARVSARAAARTDPVRRPRDASRPRCRACGLDFAAFNVGDGPAAFLILIVGGADRRRSRSRSSWPPSRPSGCISCSGCRSTRGRCARRAARSPRALLLALEYRQQRARGPDRKDRP